MREIAHSIIPDAQQNNGQWVHNNTCCYSTRQ